MRRRLATLFAVGALLTGMLATGSIVVAANPAANLDQCANGSAAAPNVPACNPNEWVNGNLGSSKAHYFEGDSVPYRMRFSNLSTGATPIHHLIIEWDTTKSGKHALDYLTTYNRTVTTANPCAGVSPCTLAATGSTIAIPTDPQVTGTGGAATGQIPGVFTIWGGSFTTITTAAPFTHNGYNYSNGTGFTGDKSASIQLNFTANVANPVIAWAGHIATRTDWGTGNSAVTIPGSPYHMRLVDLDGAGGNQDRSLSADAVTFPATMTIVKDVVGGTDPQDFSFTETGSNLLNPTSFVLDDDADATHSNTQTYSTGTSITNFTSYTFTEGAVTHWSVSFGDPVCTVTSGNGGTQTGSVVNRSVTINLKEGENVTCTFFNTHNVNGPTIATTLSSSTGNIGDTVHDSSTLTGATSDAGGSVKYAVYSSTTACDAGTYTTPGGTDAGTKGVTNGVVLDSNGIQFNDAGTYYWRAFYSGDANNTATSSACLDEQLVISPNTTGLTTETNITAGSIGDTLTDSATLTGATANAGGTIDFFLFAPGATCDSAAPIDGYVYSATGVPVTTNGTYSSADAAHTTGSNAATAAGTYTWVAVYTDGSNNVTSHTDCGDEDVAISPNTPVVDTTPSLVPNDQVDISNLADPGAGGYGTLTVELRDGTCAAGTLLYSVAFVPGDATHDFTGNGSYFTDNTNTVTADAELHWCTSYSGDANNSAFGPDDTNEVIKIDFNPGLGASLGIGILLFGFMLRRKRDQAS
jgi:hypothetical protein